jgi:4-amino-4-deoxy-L-arabinose transferase-like glycosyltransferase
MTAESLPTLIGPPRAWVRPRAGGVVKVLALAALMAVALVPRLVGIANNTDLGDEGNRGLQLRMMAAGFRPVSEVYASQGPLSLVVFYPLYVLFGSDNVAARLADAVYGIAGIVATVCLGWAIGGPTAGIAAGLLLALSPVYLEYSRLALVEVPSLAPTLAALVALAAYRAGGRRPWLALSAVLLAVGTLAKPMAAVAALAAGTLIVAGSDRRPAAARARRLADLLIYGVVGLAVVIAIVFLVGPAEVWDQYSWSARPRSGTRSSATASAPGPSGAGTSR